MFSFNVPVARFLVLAGFVSVLAGCALSPGMNVDQYASPADATKAAKAGKGGDVPPPGALKAINSELIREQRAATVKEVGEDVKSLFGAAQPYRIGPGDILNIVVWDHPELALQPAGSLTTDAANGSVVSNGYNVSPKGQIQFPYIGLFKAGGLTEGEVRQQLIARLAKYFKDPKVTVRVQFYRSSRVYVDGSVRTPGLLAVNDIPMTLPEALNRAGGFTPDANRAMVSITRAGRTTMINLQQMTALGVNPGNILLANGDLVRVYGNDDAKVYVLGEVTRPAAQPLRNGRLSLNQALGEAGGVSATTGEPRQIYVIRPTADGTPPELFHLDARSPAAYAMAEGFELKPRDVVYVDPTGLVRWNRVVSLILPSASAVSQSALGSYYIGR
ncbi:MAG: polysaccharide biosynthesis/export family protein [Burkholderiaceae bacterium]|jgi:polysaccharide export outer membrane protein|nr:polysaccharide biosynthesis/export family protein [Burkholderiaceae bacterium]